MFLGERAEKGQVLLVVILAAVIALTVGLAAVSRSITNTKVTTEEENSQKALSAAEAGVEELAGDASLLATGNRELSNDSSFDAKATPLAVGNPFAVNGGQLVSRDDGADVWLSHYPDYTSQWSGTLTFYWTQNEIDCTKEAALEIIVLSGASTNSPTVNRYTVDGCSSRQANNHFSSPTSTSADKTIGGTVFNNSYQLPAITSGFIARVIPLYLGSQIGVGYTTCTVISASCPAINPFPSQGSAITSTGASGNTKRTIQVVKGFPRVPIEFFPYNLFLP